MNWCEKLTSPSKNLLQSYGVSDWAQFISHSNIIGDQVLRGLISHGLQVENRPYVLDFGCGIGRVMFKLRAEHGIPTHACDVNPLAIEYIKAQKISVDIVNNSFNPPLPYPESFFDAIYSISVWTHLNPRDQVVWLKEIHRVLRIGGIALISFIGPDGLAMRRERFDTWKNIDSNGIASNGITFVPYKGSPGAYEKIGINSPYGTVIHTKRFIQNSWGEYFSVSEIVDRGIANSQSYVVLRKDGVPLP